MIRNVLILLVSIVVYLNFGITNFLFILFSILTTYIAAKFLEKRSKKIILTIAIEINAFILIFFKLYGANLFPSLEENWNLVAPMGVSYYTLGVISYVVDVNKGKYVGTKNMEDTVFKVNKEATIEIAKQLRLRDIGGIIIIDYIDMAREEDKIAIEELLKEELKKDRSKTQIEGFTKLDLMEMTRKHICSHKD